MAAAKTPRPLRQDPKPRRTDGAGAWASLKNRNPDRHYVWVNQSLIEMGPGYYEDIGYDVEVLKPGGVRPVGGRTCKDGEPITLRGLLLMSCTKARLAEIEMFGADGDSGQQEADALEAHIVDRRGIDPLRGLHARYMSMVNEIEPATPVLEV